MVIEDGRKNCDNVLQRSRPPGAQEPAPSLPFRGPKRETSTHSGMRCLPAKVRTAYATPLARAQGESLKGEPAAGDEKPRPTKDLMTELPHLGSCLDAEVRRRVAVALSAMLPEKVSALLQDEVSKCVDGVVPSVLARILLRDIIRATIARRGLAGTVPEVRVPQTKRWDENSDCGRVGDPEGRRGRNGMAGTARDSNSDTDSTTSSEWSDFSFGEILGPGVNAEESPSPLSTVAGRSDPIGNYAHAPDYGRTEESVPSLNGFSATDIGNTGAHAVRYGIPREATVLMSEARDVPVTRAASARPDRAASEPIGRGDPGGNVRLRSPLSRLKPLERVDPCGIFLSVYRPCCHGLSNEDRVRLLTLRERNCSANGNSSATVPDGRHKILRRNYSGPRSTLRDMGAESLSTSATPSGNNARQGKKRRTRRSRKGKKDSTDSESDQLPPR